MSRVRTRRTERTPRQQLASPVAGVLLALASACSSNSPGGADLGGDGGLDAAGPVHTDACALSVLEPENQLAAAACRGIGPFVRGEFDMAFDLLLGDVTRRRFGVESLSPLWDRYEAALIDQPSVQLRTFARVGDAAATVSASDLDMLGAVDAFTGRALHCVDHPLPAEFSETLAANVELGGYGTTHALLALIWLRDLGCVSPTTPTFFESVVAATAALVDTDHSVTSDLEVESAALLAYLGEAERLPAGFLSGLLANQQASGAWSEFAPDGAASGHTSGLALWYLHEMLFPGRTVTMVSSGE